MRIQKYVKFEDEIEIDLSVEDLRGILCEAEVKDAEHRMIVLSNLSTALRILQNVPEKWMKEFSGQIKKTTIDNLQKALDIWRGE